MSLREGKIYGRVCQVQVLLHLPDAVEKKTRWLLFFLRTTGCLQRLNKTKQGPAVEKRHGLWGLGQNVSGLVAAQSRSQSLVRPKPSRARLLTQTPRAWHSQEPLNH